MVRNAVLLLLLLSLPACVRARSVVTDQAGHVTDDRGGPELGLADGTRGHDGPRAPDGPTQALFADDFSGAAVNPAWMLWRMQFEQVGGRLQVKPAPRVGFNYGHNQNGRGATAIVGIGKPWTDYRFSFTFHTRGVDPSYDPYSLGSTYRGMEVVFRVASEAESWNDPTGITEYHFGVVLKEGTWDLARQTGLYLPGTGWSPVYLGESRLLAKGADPIFQPETNQMEIEVRGARIIVRANGKVVVDHLDTPSHYDSGVTRQPILHGGVGVRWPFETVGWIDDVRVSPL